MTSHRLSPIARRSALVVGIVLVAAACSDEATAPQRTRALPQTISAVDNPDLMKIIKLPPAPDGIISVGEYSNAAFYSFNATVPLDLITVPTTVTVYTKREGGYLYFATVFDRKSERHPNDRVSFEFDLDNDGITEDGDDVIGTTGGLSPNVARLLGDSHRYNGGMYTKPDYLAGGTNETLSAWGSNGSWTVFETRHPLNSSNNAHDMSINTNGGAVTVGLRTMLSLEAGDPGSLSSINSFKPSQTGYCQLTIGNTTVQISCPQ